MQRQPWPIFWTIFGMQTIFGPKGPSLRIFLFTKGIKSSCSNAFFLHQAFKMKINNIFTTSIIIISITLSRALVIPSIEADDLLALEKRGLCPCTSGRGGAPSPYCCPNYTPPTEPLPGQCSCLHGTPSAACCPGYVPPPPAGLAPGECACLHGTPSASCCWESRKVPSANFLKAVMKWIEVEI